MPERFCLRISRAILHSTMGNSYYSKLSNRVLRHLNDLDCLWANQLSVNKFKSKVANLVKHHEFLPNRANADGAAADNPVVAEITKGNRFLARFGIWHKFRDDDLLAKDGIIVGIPEQADNIIRLTEI